MEPQIYQYLNTLAEKLVQNAVGSVSSFEMIDVRNAANLQPGLSLKDMRNSYDLNKNGQLMIESDSETSEWEPPKRISVLVQTVKQKEPPASVAMKRLLRAKDARIKELEKALLEVQTELELLKISHLDKTKDSKEHQTIERDSLSRSMPRRQDIYIAPLNEGISEMVFKSQKVSNAISLELSSTIPISPSIHELFNSDDVQRSPNKPHKQSEMYYQNDIKNFLSPKKAEVNVKQSPEFAFMGREGAAENFKDFFEYELKDFEDMREVSIFDYPEVQDSSLYTLNPQPKYSHKIDSVAIKTKDATDEIVDETENEEEIIPLPWLQVPSKKKTNDEAMMRSLNKKASRELSLSYFHENLDLDLLDKMPIPHSLRKSTSKENKTKTKLNTEKSKEILNRSIDSKTNIKDRPRPFTQADSKRPPKMNSRPKAQSKPICKSSSLPPIEAPAPIKTAFEHNTKEKQKKSEPRPLSMKSKKRTQNHKPKGNFYTVESGTVIDDLLGYVETNEGEVWDRVLFKMRNNPDIVNKLITDSDSTASAKSKIPPPIKLVPLRDHFPDSRSNAIPQTSEERRNIKEIKLKSTQFAVNSVPFVSHKTSKQNSPKSVKTEETSMEVMDSDPRSVTVISVSPTIEINKVEIRSARSTNVSEMSLVPDWSNSLLDKHSSSEAVSFNLPIDKNSVLLSPAEIDELLRRNLRNDISSEEIKILLPKIKTTIEILCIELQLSNSYANLSNMSEQAFGAILRQCKKFMRARKLTIDILCLIRQREEMFLSIMSLPDQFSLQHEYKKLLSLSRNLLEFIGQWKVSGLPYTKFIFLGNDYSSKVHEDNANILALFPNIQF